MPAFFNAHGVLTHYQLQYLQNYTWSSNCAATSLQENTPESKQL
jgi:hypothetical protein